MSNNLRTRNGMPFNFVNGLKVRGMDIESLIPGIEGIPEAGSKYQFAGDGTNKSFTLPVSPYNKDAVDVYVKQLYVHPDDYTLVGDTVTLVEAPPAVVAGETYNVVIKVSLTTLNGYVNANRVSFEGENLEDILEKGKPLANYSNLRAYAGAATQIRITDPGIAGFFYYDPVDTTSVDNGGTIIVSGNGKRWRRLYEGAVNVKWFGAKGNGADDDTAALQAAIYYCKTKLTTLNNSVNGGFATLYVPQGIYVVSSTLNVSSIVGFRIFGDGRRCTQIVFTGENTHLFSYTVYIYCAVENITFIAGSVSFQAGLPQVIRQVLQNNTCFKFNGSGGGTDMKFMNCDFTSWNKVFTTTDSTVNDDGHQHYNCQFFYNKIVWDNTNTQAVIWSFTDCKAFHTETTVFNNPGANLNVRAGDYINPGDFLTASLTSTGIDSTFSDIRFENYQNINPSASPRILVLSGSHYGIIFERCSARGGGSLDGKTSASISGSFEITMRDCKALSGNWDINVSSAASNITSLITLQNTNIKINQTVSGTTGNRPLNINYIDFPNSTNSRINRYFRGATGSQTIPIDATPMVDSIAFQGAVNATTISRSVPVFVVAPYYLVLANVKFVVSNNTVNNFDLVVWKDSTKTIKLCELLGINANGSNKVFSVLPATWSSFNADSAPLFLEIVAAGNAGTISGQISFEFMQTY